MDMLLNDIEVRIIGCLIEKELTTPDYYPLTLNALTNACNQKSNRNPVVTFEETTVVRGLESLQLKELAEKIFKADSRVPKYQHSCAKKYNISRRQIAVLCELMLRGPQTMGEIRARAERMHKFEGLHEVENLLDELTDREHPLVIKMPRQIGRKERRFMHLLSGEPETKEKETAVPSEAATLRVQTENERITKVEEELAVLRRELDDLKKDFIDLKSQFD